MVNLDSCKKRAPKHKWFKSNGELGIGTWKLCSATLNFPYFRSKFRRIKVCGKFASYSKWITGLPLLRLLFSEMKQRTACIIDVWGYKEILRISSIWKDSASKFIITLFLIFLKLNSKLIKVKEIIPNRKWLLFHYENLLFKSHMQTFRYFIWLCCDRIKGRRTSAYSAIFLCCLGLSNSAPLHP